MEVEKESHQYENTKCSTAAVITFGLGKQYSEKTEILLPP